MRRLSPLHWLIVAVAVTAVAGFGVSVARFGFSVDFVLAPQTWLLVLMVGLAMRFPLLILPATRFGTKFSVATVATFAAALLYAPPIACLIVAVATAVADVSLNRRWYVATFNAATHALTVGVAGWAMHFFRDGNASLATYLQNPNNWWTVVVAAAAAYVLNTFLVAAATGLHTRRPVVSLWRQQRKYDFIHETILFLIAVPTALTAETAPWAMVLASAPAGAVYYAFRRSLFSFDDARRLIEDLAGVIEDRMPRARGHTKRVAELAADLAKAMKLSPEEVETIRAAALVHDVGMLNMDPEIQHSEEALSEEDEAVVQMHPGFGARIVSRSPMYQAVAPIVAAHHERWDGMGYPNGIQKQQIPIGARILAVADVWDGLLWGLDGHPRLAPNEAYQMVMRDRGTAFDPQVVDQLIGAMSPRMAARVDRQAAAAVQLEPQSSQ